MLNPLLPILLDMSPKAYGVQPPLKPLSTSSLPSAPGLLGARGSLLGLHVPVSAVPSSCKAPSGLISLRPLPTGLRSGDPPWGAVLEPSYLRTPLSHGPRFLGDSACPTD